MKLRVAVCAVLLLFMGSALADEHQKHPVVGAWYVSASGGVDGFRIFSADGTVHQNQGPMPTPAGIQFGTQSVGVWELCQADVCKPGTNNRINYTIVMYIKNPFPFLPGDALRLRTRGRVTVDGDEIKVVEDAGDIILLDFQSVDGTVTYFSEPITETGKRMKVEPPTP